MYLHKLQIVNFRCIEKLLLEFNEGVNVVIGENNTGKTAILDALRLVFSIGSQRREIYVTPDDFYVDRFGERRKIIEFHLTFSGVSDEERGTFFETLSVDEDARAQLQLHVRYTLEHRKGLPRIMLNYWGGENEGQSIPAEVMDLFYFVYLGALRDASRDLSPRRGNRLAELLSKLVRDQKKQDELAKSINEMIKQDRDWREHIVQAEGKINIHLQKSSISGEAQTVKIDFVPMEFRKIAETLRMFNPVNAVVKSQQVPSSIGQDKKKLDKYFLHTDEDELLPREEFMTILESDPDLGENERQSLATLYRNTQGSFEIAQNGLGYNNLVYIAAVLGDLLERKQLDRQAYVTLLMEEPEAHLHPQLQNVLFRYFREMGQGEIQVFISSHSPTITAKTEIDSTIVLYRQDDRIRGLRLDRCPLDTDHKRYLERFLDVTKSQLFFAKGVLLVEGISETLLLPVFADIIGKDYSLEKNGIEVVNIGGTAFEPFARLFNSQEAERSLGVRCAIITDDDRDDGSESPRAKKARDLQGGNLKTFLGERTLEYEIYVNGNGPLLVAAYQTMHPQFTVDMTQDTKEQARELVCKLRKNKDKAVFAQRLAFELRGNGSFRVPKYIQKAIKWVTS